MGVWIMTATGWYEMQPRCENHVLKRQTWSPAAKAYVDDDKGEYRLVEVKPGLPSPNVERGGYDGGLPSQSLVDFVNKLKDKMVNFDDGERMRYSRFGGRGQTAPDMHNTRDIRPWRL